MFKLNNKDTIVNFEQVNAGLEVSPYNPVENIRWSTFKKIINGFQQLTIFEREVHYIFLTGF